MNKLNVPSFPIEIAQVIRQTTPELPRRQKSLPQTRSLLHDE